MASGQVRLWASMPVTCPHRVLVTDVSSAANEGERPVARQRVGRGSGVVFGGDSGGGFLAEADVGAEAGQVLVAALGLEFGCGFRCRALRVPRPPGSERGALVAGSMKALGRKTVARLRIDRTSASILIYYVTR
jgi:hypothetical protein